MRKNALLSVCSVTTLAACWFLSSQVSPVSTGAAAPAAGFTPVMPTLGLMIEQDRHFDRIRELIRFGEEKDRFEQMAHSAMALAEMANINSYHKGANKNEDYRAWTLELKSLSVQLADHARAKKLDKIKATAKLINSTCKACHDKYQ
jgi:soluble cytochrome b562